MEPQEADVATENKTQFLPDLVVYLMSVFLHSSQLVMVESTERWEKGSTVKKMAAA
jgi:hypothetical protein